MNIKSLGYRTDFIFNKFDGSVTDRGDYYLVKFNSNPNFFWGNLLMYKQPPKVGDYEIWKSDFKKELTDPKIYHMTFAWDSPTGEVGETEEFINNGFELDTAIVLTADQVIKPPNYNPEVIVRTISSNKDFEKAIDVQTDSASDHKELSQETWKKFYTGHMAQYKKMINQGLGHWFGAFLNDELVGSLGIFTDGNVGRFQIVSTANSQQRKGVCRTLVYESAKYAFHNMGVKTLVMVADEEYHAARIYESVGFKPTQKQAGLCWWDKSKTS